ncbi:MAG: hypothetical protein PUH10_08980, partial [Erysipelotrichaceae bacterium]|uniref:hypothetical protein n=1 Tax=Floccifex sp. TaxID=2815810 RepID=UPI002A7A8B49|nr:hypothetical protein [Erysipelotrichaceae bacterium]MDY2958443.1 hypothetical protein [Floccifex sp.]
MNELKYAQEQLDTFGKILNTYKGVVARYLKYLIPEYKDLELNEIISLFEEKGNRLQGLDKEFKFNGTAVFDLLFKVKHPTKDEYILIDIELQAKDNLEYKLESRATHYASLLVANQYGLYYKNPYYDKIYKCYSIWIVLKHKKSHKGISLIENSTKSIDNGQGIEIEYAQKGNIIFVYYDPDSNHPIQVMTKELIDERLNAAYVNNLRKYGIMDIDEQEVSKMCNYHEFVLEKGISQGIDIGRSEGINIGLSEGIDIGRSEGIDIGRSEGIEIATLKTIKKLMSSFTESFDKVCDLLDINENEREK